jgi:SpoVK/Ycf46/Vps4 family AAA+-type ATPase
VLGLLDKVARQEGQPLFVWSAADGLRRRDNPLAAPPAARKPDALHDTMGRAMMPDTRDIGGALKHIHATSYKGIYVLLDVHPYLKEPVILRLLKSTALEYEKTPRTVVLVGHKIELPDDLRRLCARFELVLPDAQAIRNIIRDEAQRLCKEPAPGKLKGQQEALDLITQYLAGTCEDDARRLVGQCLGDDCALTMDDVGRVLKFKKASFGENQSAVELELETTKLSDVAGLENLKRWLTRRRAAFLGDAAGMGLDAPKGVLLLGVQGAGKSLAAKAVAGTWGVPLLRLDFATLYNKWLGETERNLREALKFADAMAPCVLWMDEIEKGVATDRGEGGESRRLLGTILTWMAERKSKVFMVATANDIEALPPELIRKGRFDEIFFVDLPDSATRDKILEIHLARRKLDPKRFDLAALSRSADGFSGAEIEQAIVSALYEAHALQQPLATDHIHAEISRTRPLAVVMGDKVNRLRAWAADRTVPA